MISPVGRLLALRRSSSISWFPSVMRRPFIKPRCSSLIMEGRTFLTLSVLALEMILLSTLIRGQDGERPVRPQDPGPANDDTPFGSGWLVSCR